MRNDPDDGSLPRSWLGLKEAGGRAYEQGEYEEALNLYRMALRPEYECALTADRQVILSNIVACRLKIGGQAQASAAVNDAKQCVELNPSWGKGHVRLASAFSALGKSNDACNSLQTALRLDPGNRMAREMLVRELRRERSGSWADVNASSSRPPEDDADDGLPPPENPNYVPPPEASTTQGVDGTQVDVDDGWTLRDRLRFHRGQVVAWYTSQSDEVRNIIKAAMMFLVVYIAFGGRFGLESAFSQTTTRPTRGNYGAGNAYDQFYRERASSSNYYDSSYRTNSHRTHARNTYSDYDYGDDYGYRGRRSSYGYSGSSWDASLPSIALVGGLAYLCHVAGINPLHALMMMNVFGRRRVRHFGGGFGGGFGGYRGGFRRRRGPGVFFW